MNLGFHCVKCGVELTTHNAYGRLDKEPKKCITCVSTQRLAFYKYGLSYSQYKERLDKQGNVCAICKRKPDWFVIDHDHTKGFKAIRGILCHTCNVGLGNFKDNPTIMQNAIDYLKEPTY